MKTTMNKHKKMTVEQVINMYVESFALEGYYHNDVSVSFDKFTKELKSYNCAIARWIRKDGKPALQVLDKKLSPSTTTSKHLGKLKVAVIDMQLELDYCFELIEVQSFEHKG